jgi:hypothetical protein
VTVPLPIVALLILLLQEVPGAAAAPQVVIDRRPPTVERVLFDPKNPPADMPKLHPGEAALCQMNFNCQVQLKYEVVEQGTSSSSLWSVWSGRASVSARVKRIQMTLTLHDTIYIPRGGNAKIRAHEEGHRVINERVYEDAERVARAAALDVLTQTWRGTGDDAGAAGKAATDEAVKKLCDRYLAGTADKAHRVGQIYDELTDHGRNTRLTEADAIRQAFARYVNEPRGKPTAAAK